MSISRGNVSSSDVHCPYVGFKERHQCKTQRVPDDKKDTLLSQLLFSPLLMSVDRMKQALAGYRSLHVATGVLNESRVGHGRRCPGAMSMASGADKNTQTSGARQTVRWQMLPAEAEWGTSWSNRRAIAWSELRNPETSHFLVCAIDGHCLAPHNVRKLSADLS